MEDDEGDRESGRPFGCAILDVDLECSVYECGEGLGGYACVFGELCSEGCGNLFRWGVLGGGDWQWYAVASRLSYVGECN